MRNSVIISAILCVFLLAGEFSFGAGKAIICGSVENPVESNVSLYRNNYYDLTGGSVLSGMVDLDENKTFKFFIDCDDAEKLTFKTGEYVLLAPLYVFPGDSIFLTLKFTDTSFAYGFSGKGDGVVSNIIYKEYAQKYGVDQAYRDKYESMMANDTLPKILKHLEDRKIEQLKYYKTIEVEPDVPEKVKNDIKYRIIYDWANTSLGAIISKSDKYFNDNRKPFKNENFIEKVVKGVELDNPDAKTVPAYISYIQSYLTIAFFNWIYERHSSGKTPTDMESFKQIFEIANTKFKGISKDIALSKIFLDFSKDISTKEQYSFSKEQLDAFVKNTSDNHYADEIVKYYKKNIPLIQGGIAPDFTLKDINGKEVSLSDFLGKVVYIDFWGTWCGPCKKEIPHYKALQEKFKENQEVVFISVAMERGDRGTWERFVKGQQLMGTQLYSNRSEDNVGNLYRIQSVPTFMLVDKQGIMISTSAKRPSQSGVEADIRALMEK